MIKSITEIGIEALEKAHSKHDELGAAGEIMLPKNQYGDSSLRADVEAEKAVLKTLEKYGVPIKVVSEEHGTTILGDEPQYLGILDGIDGSDVYKKSRGVGRYGTMFGVFSNTDPLYDDYLFGGIIEHTRNLVYFATKNGGAFMRDQGKYVPIRVSKTTDLTAETKIYADEYFEFCRTMFRDKLKEFRTDYVASSCIHFSDLVKGEYDAVLEATRKGNLEFAIAYGMVKEAGGEMMTFDEESLGSQKYFEFGQSNAMIPVVTTATKKLAQKIIKHIY